MVSSRKVKKGLKTTPVPLFKNTPARPTAGVFLGQLEERFQSLVWPGMADAAEQLDLNLIFFPGAPLGITYGHMAQRNEIYNLASPENLDGLIILSGTIAGWVDMETFYRFFERFRSLPMVSMTLPLEGAFNILVDNKKGMYDAVSHLIEVHGYRRIACLRGPVGHPEAELRFQAYVEALTSHGLPVDMDLVAPGQFTATSSRDSVRRLLDQSETKFDALVSTNDRMAVGAIEVIQSRGLSIPGEIPIIGFDDIEESRYTIPPLTTVKQPLNEMGRKSVEMLNAVLQGETVPETVLLPAQLVIRQSCGCSSPHPLILESPGLADMKIESITGVFADQRQRMIEAMQEAGNPVSLDPSGAIESGWPEALFDNFAAEITQNQPGKFLLAVDQLLHEIIQRQMTTAGLSEMLSTLRMLTIPILSDPRLLMQAENLWHQAQVMIGEVGERIQAYIKYQTILRGLQISDVGQVLLTTFDVKKLMDVAFEHLPELDIRGCFIALYEGSEKPGSQARLTLAYDGARRFELGPGEILFPSNQLIPAEIPLEARRRTWVITPLYFQYDHLGYIVMEIGPRDGAVYETIRRYISSALKGALLLEERLHAEGELKKYRDFLEERVLERTNELYEINLQLQREIAERKLAEEQIRNLNEELERRVIQRTAQLEATNSELEAFTYSVSHDLRAPLRAILGFSTILFEDFLEDLNPEAQDYLKRVQRNARQMDQLVLDLLAFSRLGRQAITKQEVDCAVLARQVVEELSAEMEDRVVEIEVADMPLCRADPALLKQVFANLISNALKFTRNCTAARIQVYAEQQDDKNVFVIQDNGVGFDPNYSEKLFGVFQRLHSGDEYEGTGVGLATVKRIITRHGGAIWAEGAVDQGAAFYFTVA